MNWVEKYGKIEAKHTIWALFSDMYRYTLNMYRYMLGYCNFVPTCTGTSQGCTGTCDALFCVSTSFNILAITCSFLIQFELFKWLLEIDFKENQTSRNRRRPILIISVLKKSLKVGLCASQYLVQLLNID